MNEYEKQGAADYYMGALPEDNPYKPMTTARLAWTRGWLAAQKRDTK